MTHITIKEEIGAAHSMLLMAGQEIENGLRENKVLSLFLFRSVSDSLFLSLSLFLDSLFFCSTCFNGSYDVIKIIVCHFFIILQVFGPRKKFESKTFS